MTREQIAAYVAEVERRFRERTPARSIDEVLPEQRVGRGEMRRYMLEQFGVGLSLDDVEALAEPLLELFRRLRREFPGDRW